MEPEIMANRNMMMRMMFLIRISPNEARFQFKAVSATAGKRIPSEEKPIAPTNDNTGDRFGTAIAMATETTNTTSITTIL